MSLPLERFGLLACYDSLFVFISFLLLPLHFHFISGGVCILFSLVYSFPSGYALTMSLRFPLHLFVLL